MLAMKCQKVGPNSFRSDTTHFYDVSRSFYGISSRLGGDPRSSGETRTRSDDVPAASGEVCAHLDDGRTSPGELPWSFDDGRASVFGPRAYPTPSSSAATGSSAAARWAGSQQAAKATPARRRAR